MRRAQQQFLGRESERVGDLPAEIRAERHRCEVARYQHHPARTAGEGERRGVQAIVDADRDTQARVFVAFQAERLVGVMST